MILVAEPESPLNAGAWLISRRQRVVCELIVSASFLLLRRSKLSKCSIQRQVICDLHSASDHEGRGECEVLHDQPCDAGADRPKNIACQVGESTGKCPF